MIARRVKNATNGDRAYQDFPCDRTTGKIEPGRLVTVYIVGGQYDGKALSLTPGSPDIIVTIDKGETVEVYHEPNHYVEDDEAKVEVA